MGAATIIGYILIVVLVNLAILRALLACKTWAGVRWMLIMAVLVQVVSLVTTNLVGDSALMARKLISGIAFGITAQVLMFFLRNLILVKMREVRAKAFGQKIAPSQGFAKDYLLHIPQMRTEAIIIFLIVTLVELGMLVLPML